MPVYSKSVLIFYCICDVCGKNVQVTENHEKGVYNRAQAVRSLRWSYGKDKSVKCDCCRKFAYNDHYA